MSIKHTARLGTLLAAMAVAGMANAASIVSDTITFAPTTELVNFDGYDGLAVGADLLVSVSDSGGNVKFTSTAAAMVGAFEQDLGGNGLWGARYEDTSTTGTGNFMSAVGPVLFNFGAHGPQAQVGAYFNLSQALTGAKTNSLTLTAYGENMQMLESFSYTVDTPVDSYNQGKFLGFARASADIHNFGISATEGSSLVLDNLALTMAPVPEPETYALMLAGLLAVGAAARRRRS